MNLGKKENKLVSCIFISIKSNFSGSQISTLPEITTNMRFCEEKMIRLDLEKGSAYTIRVLRLTKSPRMSCCR
jgi:hypothetical protein